jgi:hypothetical protein
MLKYTKNFLFDQNAKKIKKTHWHQTENSVRLLNEKYEKAVFGEVSPWDLVEKLADCVDPSDRELYGISQLIHTFQALESMEKHNVKNEEYIVGAILHDVGKTLLLTGENPANVVCDNGIITGEKKSGWDNCITHWNHDEFAYMRFKNYVPHEIAWLIRYHSMNLKQSESFADARDKELIQKFLLPFKKHDKLTKSICHVPKIDIEKYKRLLEKHLPKKIMI